VVMISNGIDIAKRGSGGELWKIMDVQGKAGPTYSTEMHEGWHWQHKPLVIPKNEEAIELS
jgi:hypothetical protein